MNTIEARRFQRALHLLLLSPRAKAGDTHHPSAHRTSPASSSSSSSSAPASSPAAVQPPVVGVDDLDHFAVAGLSMDELILRLPNRTLARVLLRQLREVEERLQYRGGEDGRDGGEDAGQARARNRGGRDRRDGGEQGQGEVSDSDSESNNGGTDVTDGGSNGGSISRRRRTAHDRRHGTARHDGAEGSTTASPPTPTPTPSTPSSRSDEEEESRPRTGREPDWMRRMRQSTLVDIIRTWGGEPNMAAERLIQSYPN